MSSDADSSTKPSAASRWRRLVVGPLLRAYASESRVQVVLLSGSTARGDADRWSDVEIGVFWSAPPDDDIRTRLAATGGAQVSGLFMYEEHGQVWFDELDLATPRPEGLRVEVVHRLTSSAERLLELVLDEHAPEPIGLNLAQGIADGTGFHGDELVAQWKARVALYPDALAVAVIESGGVIEEFWQWEVHVDRGNPVLLVGWFSAVCEQVLNILLALNRQYGPRPKRLDAFVAALDVGPPRLGERLRQVFTVDAPVAARILSELVEETFTLVETELPDVDVDRLRRIFRRRRSPVDTIADGL
jgi:hypothetical protein